jgi:hypothetical protein
MAGRPASGIETAFSQNPRSGPPVRQAGFVIFPQPDIIQEYPKYKRMNNHNQANFVV